MNGPSEAAHLLRLARKDHQAMRALSDPKVAAIETFGFHAQQAVEKALKAWLDLSGQLYLPDFTPMCSSVLRHSVLRPSSFVPSVLDDLSAHPDENWHNKDHAY